MTRIVYPELERKDWSVTGDSGDSLYRKAYWKPQAMFAWSMKGKSSSSGPHLRFP